LYFGKVFISGGSVLCFSTLCLLASTQFLFITLIAALFHEAGHLLAIKLLGGKITELRIESTGAAIIYDGRRMSYKAELLTALAGPAFSFILAYIAARIGRSGGEFWFTLSGVSLVLCLFNLLPALTLDGGRMLYMALAHFFTEDTAEKICFLISCLVSLVLTLSGLWLLMRTGWNFTLLISGIWLFLGTAIVKRRVWV
jgi:stage IV sporulation protein FB